MDAPGNSPDNDPDSYNLQICLSWPLRDGYLGREKQLEVPDTQEDRHKLFLEFAASYAEPFRSVMEAITADTEIKNVDLSDWPPPKGFHTTGNVILMGDSLHQMAMCKSQDSTSSNVALGRPKHDEVHATRFTRREFVSCSTDQRISVSSVGAGLSCLRPGQGCIPLLGLEFSCAVTHI